MRVVLDANTVFAGAGGRGENHFCLTALARRRITAFATAETLEELRALVRRIGYKCKHSPHTIVAWYVERVKLIEPAPLGKRRSRDLKDDPYLACALAARAELIVTSDKDLLDLGKPFGVAIIKPHELLLRLNRKF